MNRQADYPCDRCVHELLEVMAGEIPDVTAVEFEGRSLTYADLHAKANQLARRLKRSGVGPEVVVGVCLDRSLEMVVSLLGILKAGGAYLPLDPSFGEGRIQYALNEAGVKIMLTHRQLLGSLPRFAGETLLMDADCSAVSGESVQPLPNTATPSNLAYVIYTSGSTGKPKGVQLEHRSVVNFLCSMLREPGMRREDVLVAVTTLSFDIAGLEMFLPQLAGARLVIARREAIYDGNRLMALLERSHASVMQATPATWRLLFECGWKGNRRLKVLVGGEALPPGLARRLAEGCGEVWNMYGPTETTIWSSIYRVEGLDEVSVPIGKPIANTALHILDANGQPLPPGSEGELCIGGEGLARGYIERPELTAEKFVPDPFAADAGARMYRTGDLARRRPDSNVEFLGRIDHQVKVRGFRIELGEIEAVLEQHAGVRQAVAAAREHPSGEKYLVAYFVPAEPDEPSKSDLRQHLRAQLPDYMIPQVFVRMAALPLTFNGKVDRKALPAINPGDHDASAQHVAPRDDIERKLAAMWEEVLGVRPGMTDSFFDLGGRSLMAARLFLKIARELGKELPLSTLVDAPTVGQLAALLRTGGAPKEYPTLVAMRAGGANPPFFCVHGGAGSTLFMQRLAQELGPRQPFYSIEPEGLDGGRFHRTHIEEMAAHYLAEIRKVQPEGPYYLGGYCFGGLVAFEMAQQLLDRGDRAALLALFTAELRYRRRNGRIDATLASELPAPELNPELPRPQRAAPERSAREKLARLAASPGQTLGWRLRQARARWWTPVRLSKLVNETLLTLGRRVPPAMRTMYVVRTLAQAERAYAPKPYPGTVVLFHGSQVDSTGPDLGWEGLAQQLEHCVIGEGGHDDRRDLMDEPLVGQTARELTACIDEACSLRAHPRSAN